MVSPTYLASGPVRRWDSSKELVPSRTTSLASMPTTSLGYGCISDVTHYMFKRLPFGISSAQDIFQSIMSQIFEDIERVEVIVDDVLVWGSDIAEHDQRLQKVPNNATSS